MEENKKIITSVEEVPDYVMEKAKEMAEGLPEGSNLGVMPIKRPLQTKIYVMNTRKAEELCDMLCANIPGSNTIANILKEKYNTEDEYHLPVDTSDGSFKTTQDNSYINIFTVKQPCMVVCNEDQDSFKLAPFCETLTGKMNEDGSPSEFHNYVSIIYVNEESIIQCFTNDEVAIMVFKSRMDKEIYATFC